MNEIEKLKTENSALKEEINILKGSLEITQGHLEKVVERRVLDKYKNK